MLLRRYFVSSSAQREVAIRRRACVMRPSRPTSGRPSSSGDICKIQHSLMQTNYRSPPSAECRLTQCHPHRSVAAVHSDRRLQSLIHPWTRRSPAHLRTFDEFDGAGTTNINNLYWSPATMVAHIGRYNYSILLKSINSKTVA